MVTANAIASKSPTCAKLSGASSNALTRIFDTTASLTELALGEDLKDSLECLRER
jgi:hypothetical protein